MRCKYYSNDDDIDDGDNDDDDADESYLRSDIGVCGLLFHQHNPFQLLRTQSVQLLRVQFFRVRQFRRENERRQRNWRRRRRDITGSGLNVAVVSRCAVAGLWGLIAGHPANGSLPALDEHLVTSWVCISRCENRLSDAPRQGNLLLDCRIFVLWVVVERRVDERFCSQCITVFKTTSVSGAGSLCTPPLPLEVGPLFQLGSLGERCKYEPQPKSILVHFSLKIRHLVATILMIFLRINCPNFIGLVGRPPYQISDWYGGPLPASA